MPYGLKGKHIEAINSVFSKYPQIEKTILYGSRAKGNYRNRSDIDLTLKGEALTLSILSKIETELDDLLLPYKIDISIHHKIENPDLLEHMDRVGIVFYEKGIKQWKERTLDELAELENNNWKVGGEKMPYIALEHIIENDLRINGIGSSDEVASNKYYFTPNNFLFGKLRPYFRKLYRPNFNGICSTDIWVIKPKGENDKNFLFYFFANQEFVEQSYSTSGGTRMPRADWKYMSNTRWLFPEPEEQKAIASVLSSLDDKIDLLHRQNQTLEQMAETLFRQWFIEEADESWEVLSLSDIAEVKNGFAFNSKSYIDYTPDSLEVFKMGHIEKGGGLRANPKKNYASRSEKLKRYILNKNDIVMAMTDMKDNVVILGVPAMIYKCNHYVLNQRVACIFLKSNKKLLNQYFLYIQLKNKDNIAILQSKANSGVQVNLSTQTIKDIEVIVPPFKIQQEREASIVNLFDKSEKNISQIRTLEKLRDTLLPKLMSGEIRVDSE